MPFRRAYPDQRRQNTWRKHSRDNRILVCISLKDLVRGKDYCLLQVHVAISAYSHATLYEFCGRFWKSVAHGNVIFYLHQHLHSLCVGCYLYLPQGEFKEVAQWWLHLVIHVSVSKFLLGEQTNKIKTKQNKGLSHGWQNAMQ